MTATGWLRRYANGDGFWYDRVNLYQGWSCATDRKTLIALADGGEQWRLASDERPAGLRLAELASERNEREVAAHQRLMPFLKATPEWAFEADANDLLRFCGYVEKSPCGLCFRNVEELYAETVTRDPEGLPVGGCVDCFNHHGWLIPALPDDTWKAWVAGVLVCMSRLAWSIPPELVHPSLRVRVGRTMAAMPTGVLVIDSCEDDWRICVSGCSLTSDVPVVCPTFYHDPIFAQMWQASRDCPAARAALADWLSDRDDPFAEVLR